MTATEPRVDAKAGWSSWCRRDEHVTCRTVQARCACACHGKHGQNIATADQRRAGREAARHTSNLCLRRLHEQCVADRCACDCHHRVTPPSSPAAQQHEEPTMTAIAEVSTPPPDVNGNGARAYSCDQCGDSFERPQGLGVHRARKHGIRSTANAGTPRVTKVAPAKRAPRPKLDAKSVRRALDDDYDPWLVVVGHLDENGAKASTVVLSTENDARQVRDLLAELGHKPNVFRLADGR